MCGKYKSQKLNPLPSPQKDLRIKEMEEIEVTKELPSQMAKFPNVLMSDHFLMV